MKAISLIAFCLCALAAHGRNADSSSKNFYGTPTVGAGAIPGVSYPSFVIGARYSGESSRQDSAMDAAKQALSDAAVRESDYSRMADTDPVWEMMVRGTPSLKSDLRAAMRKNDRAKFDSIVTTAKKFRGDHISEIRNIRFLTRRHQDARSQEIARTADSWDNMSWLDDVKVWMSEGESPMSARTEMTASDYMRQ